MLRKIAPYLAFAALGILYLFSQPLAYHVLHQLAVHLLHLSDLSTADAASPAEIWAEAQLSGWPTVGRATGKLLMAAGFYLLSSILPWLVQRSTHPAVNLWKRTGYTPSFDTLPTETKFAEASRVDNRAALRIAACIIAAAVIN